MITWKSVLNNYIKDGNRMEVEHSLEGKNRNQQVLRSETTARLIKVTEQERQIIADIRMNKRRVYDTGVESERVLFEQLTFIYRRGEWIIAKIDQLHTEKNPRLALTVEQDQIKLSQPYINRAVLSNRNDGNRSFHYNRQLAVNYANEWWNKANPNYEHMDVDCTNFVSQCLFAGGAPMNYTGKRESGWWYEGYEHGRERWSYSWTVANSLQQYCQSGRTGLRAEIVDSAHKLALADIISYDWDGDSLYQHSTIVTGFDSSGEPLVNAHTNDSRNRYWDYRDSHAWSERTRYTFLHIPDIL
ncbi:MAG: amidase domain-containing protein [Paenibacillaceae bacterium]